MFKKYNTYYRRTLLFVQRAVQKFGNKIEQSHPQQVAQQVREVYGHVKTACCTICCLESRREVEVAERGLHNIKTPAAILLTCVVVISTVLMKMLSIGADDVSCQ